MSVYKKNNSQVDNLIRKNTMPNKQMSFTEFKTLIFLTNNEGMTIDPAGFSTQNVLYIIGYMGNRRLSEQLPYNYVSNTAE
ncbi:hypothetical protein DU508_19910 [Pedobacter chinensis]|uniref:Uncharacterized protein n=1 Tax=Pedobacter chinensis TaxID=2282421 RepID=A0A369PQ43_9SPHI|nr:hypothetical protein DU508_19910 [Pedobacter chinensis]